MKPMIGVRFAGLRQVWFYLIGEGEAPPLRRCVRVSRIAWHQPAQAGEGFTDRNQLAALTLHGFILPCPTAMFRQLIPPSSRIRSSCQAASSLFRHRAITIKVSFEGKACSEQAEVSRRTLQEPK